MKKFQKKNLRKQFSKKEFKKNWIYKFTKNNILQRNTFYKETICTFNKLPDTLNCHIQRIVTYNKLQHNSFVKSGKGEVVNTVYSQKIKEEETELPNRNNLQK